MASRQPFHSTPIRGDINKDKRTRLGPDPKRKHVTSPEILKTHCARCDNKLDNKNIECNSCKLLFCVRCSGLSTQAFELIQGGGLDGYHHLCQSCKHTMPTLENIDKKLTLFNKNQEKRLSTLEDQMKGVEIKTRQIVHESLKNTKQEVLENIEDKISSMVDAKVKEIDDRRRREMNIVIFNLQEGASASGTENKEYDENNIKIIAADLGLENLEIETSYRLGKKSREKPRVLKIILSSKRDRKFLLDNAKHIKTKAQIQFRNVIIFKDLTLEQRKDRKQKREIQKKQSEQKNTNEEPILTDLDSDDDPTFTPLDPFLTETVVSTQGMNTTLNPSEVTVIGGLSTHSINIASGISRPDINISAGTSSNPSSRSSSQCEP